MYVASGPDLRDVQVLTGDAVTYGGLDLAVDARGDAVVTFVRRVGTGSSARDHVAAAYRPAGGRFGTVEALSPDSVFLEAPGAMIDDDGTAAVAWNGAFVAERPAGASAFSPPVGIGGDGWLQTVGVLRHGRMVLAWHESAGGKGFVATTERADSATAFGPVRLLTDGFRRPMMEPRMATDGDRRVLLAWRQSAPGSPSRNETVFEYNDGGFWSAPRVSRSFDFGDQSTTLISGTVTRPAMLAVHGLNKGQIGYTLLTATVRSDGRLSGRRHALDRLDDRQVDSARFAQGTRHTWLAAPLLRARPTRGHRSAGLFLARYPD